MRHATLKPRPMLMPLLMLTIALCLMLACSGTTPPTEAPATDAPATEPPVTYGPPEADAADTPSTDTPSATEAPPAAVTAPDKAGETPPSQPTEPPSSVVRFGPDPSARPCERRTGDRARTLPGGRTGTIPRERPPPTGHDTTGPLRPHLR